MRRRSCLALLVALLLAAWCPAAARAGAPVVLNPNTAGSGLTSDPAGAIRTARGLIAQGKMQDAITSLETYVFGHPNEIAPRRFLGDLYFRTGQLDRAAFTYQEILASDGGDRETHNRLGTVYAIQNRVDDAIREFDKALPGTDSVSDLVALHQRKGDLATYEAQMKRTAERYPTDPALQSEVGQIYDALYEPYIAIIYFRRALDADPSDLSALNGLGVAYLDMHDYADAQEQFTECLRLAPGAYPCANDLGAAMLEAKQYADAQRMLERARSLAPERAETYVNFGFLADALGDWHRAAAYYAQSIAVDPYVREAYIDLALSYEDHKLYPLAEATLLKGLAAMADDGRFHVLLGIAYAGEGKRSLADDQFRLALSGTNPEAQRVARLQLPNASPTPLRTP